MRPGVAIAMQPLGGEQDRRHRRQEARELLRLGAKLALSLRREPVELRLASELRRSPLGLDPAIALHSVERWIQRALFHLQRVAALVAEPAYDGVPVPRAEGQRFEHEGVERAVEAVFDWHRPGT